MAKGSRQTESERNGVAGRGAKLASELLEIDDFILRRRHRTSYFFSFFFSSASRTSHRIFTRILHLINDSAVKYAVKLGAKAHFYKYCLSYVISLIANAA